MIPEKNREIVITLKGMDCIDCVNKLQKALNNTDGIISVSLNFSTGTGRITFDSGRLTLIELERIISKLGYEMVGEIIRYSLNRIHCRDCGHELENDLESIKGVIDATVTIGANYVTINYVPKEVRTNILEKRIRSMGYKIIETEKDIDVGLRKHKREGILLGISAFLFLAGLILHWTGLEPSFFRYESGFILVHITPSNILFLISLLIPGIPITKAGLYSLKGRVITIDLLVIMAAIGAILIGTYWEATAVVFLTAVGELLQDISVERTRKELSKLLEGAPKTAFVKRKGKIIEIEIDDLRVGDIAIIKPGEKIPGDGVVFKGISSVNQAPITGESVPVSRKKGDEVFGGTVNEDGYLEVKIKKMGDDTTISRIIKLIQEAQEEKAPAQRFIERFAEIFVPVVILIAIGAYVFTGDIKNSLVLLVVACPCALVISTPVAVVSGLGNAAKKGILIKGGVALEQMGKIKTVIFDKTGTLTRGEHGIEEIQVIEGSEKMVLEMAAFAEQKSEHPISKAIMSDARKRGILLKEPEDFKVFKGKGILALSDDHEVLVGNRSLMEERSIQIDPLVMKRFDEMERKALTVFFVARNGKIEGLIGTSDTIRPEARDLVKALKKMRIRTVMLSGDNSTTVNVIGEKLGVDEVHGNLLPEDKVSHIKRLKKGSKVAMVGDGINDAPALATADIGIAMGGSGSDLTIETSDITLLSDDLLKIADTIRLSRNTMSVIKQNTGFALLVVLGLILSASVGWIGLAVGVIGHESSAMIVVLNSMRLMDFRRKKEKQVTGNCGSDRCSMDTQRNNNDDCGCGSDKCGMELVENHHHHSQGRSCGCAN